MGEWSKSVGEKGEQIVDYFFKNILGYKSVLSNESINCNKGTKHKDKTAAKDRTTHGIDALISAVSPVEDHVLDIGIISSKFTSLKYPNSPKSTFKEHFSDLAHTIECFKNSKLLSEINSRYSHINKTEITGILVWASNASDKDFNIVSQVSNIQIDTDLIFDKIIVIDNNRLNFFVETIENAKKEYGKENVKFIYHNSGLNNISLQSMSYGDYLPISYFFADIIPIRIINEGKIELLIYSKDEFSVESLNRLLDFSKSFDHLSSITTIFSFPDFNELTHSSLIKQTIVEFGNYTYQENLFFKKHTEDFRNF